MQKGYLICMKQPFQNHFSMYVYPFKAAKAAS